MTLTLTRGGFTLALARRSRLRASPQCAASSASVLVLVVHCTPLRHHINIAGELPPHYWRKLGVLAAPLPARLA